MDLIDTHTHLYIGEFDADRAEVVKRAKEKGVKKLLLPNIDSLSIPGMHEMCSLFPGICLPMIGLHPGSVNKNFEKELEIVYSWINKNKYVAIGESGIDLYWDKTFREQQLEAFRIQVEWAKQKGLPIVIHARESFSEIFSVLDRLADENMKGVFHSFTGNEDHVKVIMEYGFYFGINGIVTYKNSDLIKTLEKIPPERVLLETDSPYLSPVPMRGKRNESSNLTYIAAEIAQVYHNSLEEVALVTTGNACKLFNLDLKNDE